ARLGLRRRARADGRAADRRLVHGRQDRDRPADHAYDAAGADQRRVRLDAQGREHQVGRGVL
ncbi:MAG: S-(hydroxymethyl)glutathione dehydrogenase, partial [uncultured Sphingomonadaceae bacterium]